MNFSGAILRHAAGMLLCAFAIAFPAAAPAALEAPELIVAVANLRSGDGRIRIALWDDTKTFATDDTALAEVNHAARPGEVRFTFRGLPPGRYAVVDYHDENGNGGFDRTWIGLPDERLGFSNSARIGFGAPSFEEAAVEIPHSQRVIVVNLRYPGGTPGRTRDR
jgi:uncharacterized protein (DUF2141 family)